jgi:hypothetical protein
MRSGRRGVVLPAALLALVVIAALVGATFASAHLEQRLGRNTLYAVQAAGAAEVGVVTIVDRWNAYGLHLLGPGQSTAPPGEVLPGPCTYTSTVRRLNGQLYLVEVEGLRTDAAGTGLARRRVALVLRLADSASAPLPVVPLADRAWLPTPL